ncbi:MAG: LysM peptidoglycan-binding domain-containing protein [Rubricoccaceae bacterium]|nr:LysM peptidoglycan-binding domain-containing protein [Rubricoccaceae bacterium]
MPRALTLAVVSLFVVSAHAQTGTTSSALESRPAELLPSQASTPSLDQALADTLSNEQLARRIARLYSRQAELLVTEAEGNRHQYETQLEDLVRDVQLLGQQPGVTMNPRFREVYSSILTEYEQYYDEPALDRGEIYPFLARAFEEMHAVDGPLIEHIILPDIPAGTFDTVVPMPVNTLVERSLAYLRRSRGHVSRLQTRADTYFPMIERVLAEEGVPDEMKYLAMIESALNPRAHSHAGAGGMWQFIPATGRAYGLRVTSEVDDRLDPERSTRAAVRHLRDLYERFGDWHLAMAGYNCNPAVIERAVRRTSDRLGRPATFWDIYDQIPRETRGYVPMFIATALVVSNPTAYNLPLGEPGARYIFDTIPVDGGTSLSAIAAQMDLDVEVLRALNPSIRRSHVPEQREPWMLRIPAGYYSQYSDALDRFAPESARNSSRFAASTVNYGTRTTRPIAPDDSYLLAQSRSTRSTIQPDVQSVADAATPVRTVADEAIEASREASSGSASAPTTRHRVRRGETLSGIARRYGVTVRQIQNWNNLSGTRIRSGQRLTIQGGTDRGSGPQQITHRVRRGENLTVIARRYGVTVRQIMNWNSLRSTTIRPGQRLRITARRNFG